MTSCCTGLKSRKERRRRFLIWALFFCILTAGCSGLLGGFQVFAAPEQVSGNDIPKADINLPDTEKESVSDNTIEEDGSLENVEAKQSELAEPQNQNEAMWQDQNGEWQYSSFTEAVANVKSGGVVVLMTDVSLTDAVVISQQVLITSNDPQNPCTIRNTTKDTDDRKNLGRIFTVTGGELKLQDIILDGGRNEGVISYHPLVCLAGQGAVLKLYDGAVLQNAENAAPSMCGGGINIRRGQLVMYDGSEIRHCKARDGGGVEVNCNVTPYSQAMFGMAGGRITDCEAGNGGGVYVNIGMFQMQGGEITGNRATLDGGGGICVAGKSGNKIAAVLIQNGKVAGNEAVSNGGGIMLDGMPNLLQMIGGTVERNTANCGGGVAVMHGNLKLYGGTVTDNNAALYGGGVLGTPDSLIELQGGPKVFGNTAGDATDHFDNLYLDGAEDDVPSWATSPIRLTGALTDGVQLGMTRWVRPDEGDHPYREMIVPDGAYTISQSDINRLCDDRQSDHKELYADNMEKYAFIPYDGKIVMVLAVNITLDRNKLSLENEGETAALMATVTPGNAPIKEVTWSSSDESIATVDTNGVVTAVSEGQAVITATTVSPYHATASCTVTVGEEEEKPTDPEPPQTPDKPTDPKPPQTPDNPSDPKPPQTPDKPEDNKGEEPTTQITPSGQKDSYVENVRMSQNTQTIQDNQTKQNAPSAGNPRTGSFILWLYAAAVLSALCMLILTFLQIRKKKREREKK